LHPPQTHTELDLSWEQAVSHLGMQQLEERSLVLPHHTLQPQRDAHKSKGIARVKSSCPRSLPLAVSEAQTLSPPWGWGWDPDTEQHLGTEQQDCDLHRAVHS